MTASVAAACPSIAAACAIPPTSSPSRERGLDACGSDVERERKTLKLATYDVNGIATRLPHLLGWLQEAQPDVVALQELKAADKAFPAAVLEKAGYGAIWQRQRSWNAVALLGRGVVPSESQRGLPGDAKDDQSRQCA